MNYENLIVEKGNHIGFIKINRPEVRNALNNETVTEILSAFEELENDQEIGVIVFTGVGKRHLQQERI